MNKPTTRNRGKKPAVPRHWLFAIAAAAWLIAGSILCTRASVWLSDDPFDTAVSLAISGLISAVLFDLVLFTRIARKNISRICRLPEQACVFAFTAWRGYFMIGAMMTLGIVLRNSPIPKEFLIIPYTAMGGALIISSVRFAKTFWFITAGKNPCPPAP